MSFILQPWQLYVVIIAGWIHRQQQEAIEYLRTENRCAGPAIFGVTDLRSQPHYHAEVMLIFKGCRDKLSLGGQDAQQEQAAADPTPVLPKNSIRQSCQPVGHTLIQITI